MSTLLDQHEALLALFAAVQGAFVLFFIISPLGGMMIGKGVKGRQGKILMLGIAFLVFNGVFAALTYLVQKRLSVDKAVIIGISGAIVAALMAVGYMRQFVGTGRSALAEELKTLKSDRPASSTFEERRRRRLKKKHR